MLDGSTNSRRAIPGRCGGDPVAAGGVRGSRRGYGAPRPKDAGKLPPRNGEPRPPATPAASTRLSQPLYSASAALFDVAFVADCFLFTRVRATPARTRAMPPSIVAVMFSLSTRTPSTMATTGSR
jgi:hypothetical protein